MFDEWMEKEKLKDNPNICFVTCGDWDLKSIIIIIIIIIWLYMLPSQCTYLRAHVPLYFKKWMNIKKVFAKIMKCKTFGMAGMLEKLSLTLDGRHHSGIDDAKNIAKVLQELLKREPNIQPTTILP